MATLIGTTDVTGGSSDLFGLDEVAASKYTAAASGSATTMSVAIRTGTSSTSMILGIYSDAAGVPGTLLGQTSAFNPGSATAVKTGTLTAPVSITASTIYHLAALSLLTGGWNWTTANGQTAGYRQDAGIGGAFEATWDVTGDSTTATSTIPISVDSSSGGSPVFRSLVQIPFM